MALPTTHALIPAAVRFDVALPPGARLLFGEITALCAQRGYCWATNDYLAGLYQVRRATISTWVQQLAERGYLLISLDQARGNHRQLRPAPDLATTLPSYALPQTLGGETVRPLPPNRTTFPEISFTELEALLLGKKNDKREWEGEEPRTLESQVSVKLSPGGAVPAPNPPVARPPLSPEPTPTPSLGFQRPTLAQVTDFFAQQPTAAGGLATPAEATRFFNYYQANGWRIGRHAMADWPAAARNWLLNTERFNAPVPRPAPAANRLHSGGSKDYTEPL